MSKKKLTFEEYAIMDPRLNDVMEIAKSIVDDGTSKTCCANKVFFSDAGRSEALNKLPGLGPNLRCFNDTLQDMVGNGRNVGTIKELYEEEALDTCNRAIYNALPDCRNCACMVIDGLINKGE